MDDNPGLSRLLAIVTDMMDELAHLEGKACPIRFEVTETRKVYIPGVPDVVRPLDRPVILAPLIEKDI